MWILKSSELDQVIHTCLQIQESSPNTGPFLVKTIMADKLDIYDLIANFIPGVLIVCWIPICFPALLAVKSPKYPDAFAVIALATLALFVGQLVQAIASLLEPWLNRSFKGRPSEYALTQGLGGRYLAEADAQRIREKLVQAAGQDGSDQSLFLFALQRTDAAGVGRSARFNYLYGYYRGLLFAVITMLLLFLASAIWGSVVAWHWTLKLAVGIGMLLLALILWNRTRQRALYYVREVLLAVERVLDDKAQAATSPPQPPTVTKG
jgi:hypothetical protein